MNFVLYRLPGANDSTFLGFHRAMAIALQLHPDDDEPFGNRKQHFFEA